MGKPASSTDPIQVIRSIPKNKVVHLDLERPIGHRALAEDDQYAQAKAQELESIVDLREEYAPKVFTFLVAVSCFIEFNITTSL